VKLKARHEARVRQSLQPALRGGDGTAGIEAAVDLTAEHMSRRGDEREDLNVERFGL
jgi:hypothetical protein